MKPLFFILCAVCLYVLPTGAQDSVLSELPSKYFSAVTSRVDHLEQQLDQRSQKALEVFQKSEARLKRKLSKIDSLKAKELFASTEERYTSLKQKIENPDGFTEYIPYLDTLKSSLKFLQDKQQYLTQLKEADKKIQGAFSKIKGLETSLAQVQNIQNFTKERRELLKSELQNLGFAKELKRLNKQAYYYSQQVQEYKEVLKDPKKIERKAIELLSRTKPFQDFMRKHSQLASLFRMPGGAEEIGGASLAGLQTRAQVNNLITQRIGGGANAQQLLQQNVQGAQAQLGALKDKVAQFSSGSYGNSGSGDMEVPDFKPNHQKTKSLLQRLEWGTNLQTQKGSQLFPVTSDLGLSLGYKLNDKSILGVGTSYKLGWGSGWDNIKITHQGLGLRSFIDYQIKGSFYVSGGYEQNYRSEIHSIEQLKNQSSWQSSGLIGLSKKYKVSQKMKGSMQLLWDFLSCQQIPKTQAILFRIGYSLK